MKIITASSIGTFRDCPRRYHYRENMQRARITEAAPLVLGKALHHALEAWWGGNGLEAALVRLKELTDMKEEDAAKIVAMLSGYNPPKADYEVMGTEIVFDVEPIINPDTGRAMKDFVLAGKIDGLLKRKSDGTLWILEHKSTSDDVQGFGPFWQRLAIDAQISYYMTAFEAAGVLYDVLRKPQLKFCAKDKGDIDAYQSRLTAAISEERDRYYQFREVVKTPDDMSEARADLWAQVHILADCEKANRWPRNSGACRSFYGVCEFMGVCTGAARIDDDTLFRDKVKQEELKEA